MVTSGRKHEEYNATRMSCVLPAVTYVVYCLHYYKKDRQRDGSVTFTHICNEVYSFVYSSNSDDSIEELSKQDGLH